MIRRFLVNLFLRCAIKSLWHTSPDVARVRRRFDLADRLGTLGRRVPPLRREEVNGIRIEWTGDSSAATQGVIVYLHGGAFALRAPRSDLRFCADLARRSGLAVLMVAYRLAPEAPFPAGLDDCCRIYAWLQQRGIASQRIVLLGHSAGANLVLGVMMRMRRRGLDQPAGAVLLSPPTDLAGASPSATSMQQRDVMFTPAIWAWVRDCYLGGADTRDPEASPLLGDWSGLAPMHFHVSGSELLLDDSRLAVERARAAGSSAGLTVWPDMPHSFAFIDLLPEAARCRVQIAEFAKRMLARCGESNESGESKESGGDSSENVLA